MPHDPECIAETRAWLSKAADDLRAAEALIHTSPPLPDIVVFHCQQAAEKTFKGFLAFHSVAFRKTHNIEEIGEQCLRVEPGLKMSLTLQSR